jgi:2-amino-4-hydroxy-6-hydroxymethyldihydropteridine diphosphokinase
LSKTTRVAVALGSNLGDRHAHLAFALVRLAGLLTDLRVSSTYETQPVDVVGRQPLFLNAAVVGDTTLTAAAMLAALLAIERARGRQRPFRGAARTLDLDLVLFGECLIEEPGLNVPHPRFRDREFVLEPLVEIAPDFRDPVSDLTLAQLLARLRQAPRGPGP